MKIIILIMALVCLKINILFSQLIVKHNMEEGLLYKDLPYKNEKHSSDYEKERCKLDIYVPKQSEKNILPVIVCFHGGGFVKGDKSSGWNESSNNFGFKFLEEEIIMVMPNYRLSGVEGTKWPDYLSDAASAVGWVENHISEYGGDPNCIFVMGFSAGAYIAHMLYIDKIWYQKNHLLLC